MANIGDVAKLLGVSRSTVSYALSGKRSVSTEMKERVQAAIRELDYYPSAAGRALATARTQTIALLAPMAENATPEVALQFVNGVAQAARSFGYDVLLVTGKESFDSVERLVRGKQVDGFVVLDVEEADPRVSALQAAGAACTLVGMPAGVKDLDRVDLDWERAGALLVEQIARAGHREFCLVGAPTVAHELGMTYAMRFISGVRTAAADAGMIWTDVAASNDFVETTRIISATLERNPLVTAFLVQHEAAVAPLLAAVNAAGKTVPDDCSVVGISIDKLGPNFAPPISGVINPSAEITRTAVEMLVERLESPDLGPRALLLPPDCRDLATVAPPKV